MVYMRSRAMAGSIANDMNDNGQTTLTFDPDPAVPARKAADVFLVIGYSQTR